MQASKEVFPNGSTEEKGIEGSQRQETLERLEARAAGHGQVPQVRRVQPRTSRLRRMRLLQGRGNRKEGSVSLLEKAERNAFRFFVMQKPGRIAPRFYLDMDKNAAKP